MMTRKELVEKLTSLIVDNQDLNDYTVARTNQILQDHGMEPYDGSGDDHIYWQILAAEQSSIIQLVLAEVSGAAHIK